MIEPLGDLAERMAQRLDTEVAAPVMEAAAIAEEAALEEEGDSLKMKFRFSWKPEDKAGLERIRISASAVTQQAFIETFEAIDWFFLQLRVPKLIDGQVMTDTDGRIVWELDPGTNKPIEEWNRINGQDVEQTLANLERIRLVVAPQVNELFLEALLAQHSAKDTYDEAWGSMMDGTQGDKTRKSNRESRTDRYHAFFRYYIYSVAKTFLDEITTFQRTLERIRYWQVQSQPR